MKRYLDSIDAMLDLAEARVVMRGLSKNEFVELKQDLKSKLGFRFGLKYWTTPKHATGQITIKAPKANDWLFTVEQVKAVLDYLIRNGYEGHQVPLREMAVNPERWVGGGITFMKLAND